MKVNLTTNEYELVCKVADYYGGYPAQLVHEWIVREAARQYSAIYAQGAARVGILGLGQDPDRTQASQPEPSREVVRCAASQPDRSNP